MGEGKEREEKAGRRAEERERAGFYFLVWGKEQSKYPTTTFWKQRRCEMHAQQTFPCWSPLTNELARTGRRELLDPNGLLIVKDQTDHKHG